MTTKRIIFDHKNRRDWAGKLAGLRQKYTAETGNPYNEKAWELWLTEYYGIKFVWTGGGISGVEFISEEFEFLFQLKR